MTNTDINPVSKENSSGTTGINTASSEINSGREDIDAGSATIKPGANANDFLISGELNFTTAIALCTRGQQLIAENTALNFDFSQVNQSSSVGLALLIAWARKAKQLGKTVSFSHLPKELLAAAKVSNLDTILPLDSFSLIKPAAIKPANT